MTHGDCKNYVELDCEKGLCALTKGWIPLDGEGSKACPNFTLMEKCGNCKHFCNPDKHGVGTCKGMEKEAFAYASCGATFCPGYEMNSQVQQK